jgi:CMP-N-acetylneuraminic acid synthetase
MIHGKKVLALTPARGGSKGLPGKNLRPFCGKPLIAHTLCMANDSKYIDKVVVSTDCKKIATVASNYGAEVFMRPAQLSTDTALVVDAIRNLIARLTEKFDFLILLQATSPLRELSLIEQCIETIHTENADSLATFSQALPPPSQLWNIQDKVATQYIEAADPWLPRQRQQDAYHLNGLIYIFNISTFLETNSKSIFFGNRIPFITQSIDVDIDTIDDFELAEHIMKAR